MVGISLMKYPLEVNSALIVYLTINRDGLLQPASGCQRAVTEAVALLEQKGYKVVPIQSPDIRKVYSLVTQSLS